MFIIGTIIGAGFISGRELAAFFGGANFAVSVVFATLLFFAVTLLILCAGKRFGSLRGVNRKLFGKADKTVNAAFYICLLAVVAAGLATTDALAKQFFGLPEYLPILSVVTLIITHFSVKSGIKGLGIINAVLVPVMILVTCCFLFAKGGFTYAKAPVSGKMFPNIALYVSFNMFLSASVISESGAALDKRCFFPSAAVSALITAVMMLLIMGAVWYEGANAINDDLPLLYVFSQLGSWAEAVFGAVLYLGAFTTLLSSYYPLERAFTRKFGGRGAITLAVGVFLLSRLGIKKIVGYVYPIAGLLGFIYFLCIAVLTVLYKIRQKRK